MGWKSFIPFLKDDNIMNKKDGHLANIGNWIGNMKFTAEEMAELDEETAKGVRKFAIDTLSENTDRSIARRVIAIQTIQFFFLLLFMSAMVYKIDPEWAAFILGLTTQTKLGWLVLGVGGFFWGTHTLRSYIDKKAK